MHFNDRVKAQQALSYHEADVFLWCSYKKTCSTNLMGWNGLVLRQTLYNNVSRLVVWQPVQILPDCVQKWDGFQWISSFEWRYLKWELSMFSGLNWNFCGFPCEPESVVGHHTNPCPQGTPKKPRGLDNALHTIPPASLIKVAMETVLKLGGLFPGRITSKHRWL